MAFQRRRQPDRRDGDSPYEDNVIKIDRYSKVVKGGRKFSFGALVVVGDRAGKVGLGYGKAIEVPLAVDKAITDARKNLLTVKLDGGTLPHTVIGLAGASKVILVPASEGTGVIAGKMLRPMLELAGIRNVLTKAYGSTTAKNLLKAGMNALQSLRTPAEIEKLRGVSLT